MKKYILLLLSLSLYGDDFLSISSNNYFANNRIIYTNNFVSGLALEKNRMDLLNKVNEFVNEFPYCSDQDNYAKSDYWAKPSEFVIQGKGDCEDYVVLKYSILKYCGVPTNELFVGVKKFNGVLHAVLLIHQDNGSFLTLDNNIHKIYIEDDSNIKIFDKNYIENHI